MMKDDDDSDSVGELRALMGLAEELLQTIDRNKEVFKSVSDTIGKNYDISDTDTPYSVEKSDDYIEITVLSDSGNIDNVKFNIEGSELELGFAGNTVVTEIPEDCVIDDSEAEMNNGVINVKIPRKEVD